MKKRDIQIHMSVTITNRVNNVEIFGEKEKELPQLCIQVDARNAPVRKMDLQAAFANFYARALEQMREAGLLKAGD